MAHITRRQCLLWPHFPDNYSLRIPPEGAVKK